MISDWNKNRIILKFTLSLIYITQTLNFKIITGTYFKHNQIKIHIIH